MNPLLLFLLIPVAAGLIRWIVLSFMLKHPAPLFIFLIVNICMTLMTLNAVGLTFNFLFVCYLLVATYFAVIPVRINPETKTTS